jgi:hypothetical protein
VAAQSFAGFPFLRIRAGFYDSSMSSVFEPVYTNDWYDGPETGVASYRGEPHTYARIWDSPGHESYTLCPIDRATLALVLEDWEIWLRFEKACHGGLIPEANLREWHPALPDDRARHDELEAMLQPRLAPDPERSFMAHGEFRATDGSTSGLEVCWTPVPNR